MAFSPRWVFSLCVLAGGASATWLSACSDDDPAAAPSGDAGPDVIALPDGGTSCPPQPAPACTGQSCTDQQGEPAACVNGACVKLKGPDCVRPKFGGDLTGGNVVVIGGLHAQSGANAGPGAQRISSMELAANEINAAGGIRDPDRCKPARTLAYVACDDVNATPDAGIEAVNRVKAGKYMTDVLKVPVIIGGSNSGNTLDIAKNVAVPAKAMVFSPTSTAVAITAPTDFNPSPDGTRLLWRAAPSDVVQAVVLQQLAGRSEVEAKLAGNAAPKVALVTRNDAYGRGIRAAFNTGFTVNGAAPTAANYTDIVYQEPVGAGAAADTALRAFAPDIVVMAGTNEATTEILQPFDAAAVAAGRAPVYVLADGQKKAALTTLVKSAGGTLRARIRGTQPGVLTALGQTFYNLAYVPKYTNAVPLSYGMAGTYDITYMIAYAIAAAKGGPIDGTTLAKNMAFLVDGEQIDVGAQGLSRGTEALRKGDKIDFNGASGPLAFDLATGEAPSDYGVWCVRIDPNTSNAIFEEASGLSYSASTQTLSGTFKCE